MTPVTHHRARAALSVLALGALLAGGALTALPASAADIPLTENGGAARHDGDRTAAIRSSLVGGPAKNVILLIGDGMGDSEITVARNYAEGAAGTFAGIDALPLTGQYVHWAVDKNGKPNYASESASTASAWSTGTKTQNGRLSVDYSGLQGVPQPTLLELAKANGMKTGNVSTAEIQDATPGAEIAHVSARSCYGPDTMSACQPDEALENGGLGSISEQLLNVRPDVTLGGGWKSFTQTAKAGPWQGETLEAQAKDRGYQVVRDAAGLAAVTEADADRPLLGLFTDGNFPTRWTGPNATVGGGNGPAVTCQENPERLGTGLELADLTQKAIDLLDNKDGFFLQVEGASIDKQDHAANACGQIGETVDLDEAVQVALAYAQQRDDTLVVVTADHAHTSQILGSTPPGLSIKLTTVEGQDMIVGYGTANAGESQQHTGAQVRIAAYGPGAANVVGLSDQTDLFFTAVDALRLKRDLASLSADAKVTTDKREYAPGEPITVTVTGLDADWQATGTLASDPVDLGQRDVLRGTATFTATAPQEVGPHTVTIAGVQTGTSTAAAITVSTTPAPGGGQVPDPGASGQPAAVGSGIGAGPLAVTGGTVPWLAIGFGAAFVAVGTIVVIRRRRRAA
ncbi:alkaline phosphatase [Microbacterium sp. 10M-3C3]|jgi:alkaline phosphatase|uniref:alkaline phosphatase n=1 Tax=Microbacterium sp. 10M-3C3 TaxID=2483401 RepID=UPI00197C265A|nr:alkaline phosphatase [Microbacterium sp. 10M-3C3]